MNTRAAQSHSKAWLIHFFQRPTHGEVPAQAFLEGLPKAVAAEMHAVINAVAEAPPPSFSGGGKWQAMHGDMAGIYEIRVRGGGQNHRLFCLLERNAHDLGGSSIICVGGLSKPPRQSAKSRDYKRIQDLVDEFRAHRTVLT